MTITIVCAVIIGFIIGLVVSSSCGKSDSFDDYLLRAEREKRYEAENELTKARQEIQMGCRNMYGHINRYMCPNCHPCYQCHRYNAHLHDFQCIEPKKVYAASIKEQEMVELIRKMSVPLDELKKNLDII